ncbi:uncharacterized protein MYU51_014165 [Penicillium brevicompactum]|uniref:uncharacterized protein n=1 Tax=Penicillium brevicompactum TaxID=5074 RepID=UPI00254228AB|nr:uncharacterized protein N7506_007230 [Penicillium brevicompactum]KAJ5333447.1 hypothetical protein N7506_007230 [Penicillium brevicompactum]
MLLHDLAIPIDSVVVVIGANGFIGLETCEKLLQAGYKVRGTVRSVEKYSTFMHDLFDLKWPGKFELVQVVDFEEEGAFDEAFKGAAGVIYTSMPIVFHPDPAKVINQSVKSTINTLEAAAKARVQRYVLCSSSKAVETARYDGTPRRLTVNNYNTESLLKVCCGPREETLEWSLNVFSAGRALAELSFWSWIGEKNPPFVANCVVPDGAFGRGLNGATSTNQMLKAALAGDWNSVPMPISYLSDVQDTARLLVAATIKSSISNERIFAYYKHLTWNDLRTRVRAVRPGLVKSEDHPLQEGYLSSVHEPICRAEEILKDIGRAGFTHEDSMLRDFLDTCF